MKIATKLKVACPKGCIVSAGTFVTGPGGETYETLRDACPRPRGFWRGLSWWAARLVGLVVSPDQVPVRRVEQYFEDDDLMAEDEVRYP